MGCCNGSVLLLVICTLQLITIVEWLVFNFLGFLYFSLIPCFIHIIFVIIAIFGLCLYKHRLIASYLIWNIIYIAWNIFVICLYLGVGTFDESSYSILGFGPSVSWWVKFTRECEAAGTCKLTGSLVEVIHASLQGLLAVIGCISSSYVIYILREKDDTSPIFQVYKAPSSRRSSISLRGDRDASLPRPDHWEAPGNGRDSIRSNRSTRSDRAMRASSTNGQNSIRQSKRSNRGSTRSRHKSTDQNGSAKRKSNSLPWVPTVAPSSGVDSDMPQSPQERPTAMGHANESYGYGSSSDNPYSDYLQRTPGPPPGPVPVANRKYRPTNLSNSFNAVADLPPPLDEGPEAYSRDSVAFPAPPPPLADGPEPYRIQHAQQQNRASQRPNQLTLHPPTPTKEALSSSCASSPGSSSLSTEKGAIPPYNRSTTLENNLERSPYHSKPNMYQQQQQQQQKQQQQQQQASASNLPKHQQPHAANSSNLTGGQRPHNLYADKFPGGNEPGEAASNPLYANHRFGQPAPQQPGPSLALPSNAPYKQPALGLKAREQTTPSSGTEMYSDYEQAASVQSNVSQKSPTSDLRQMRGVNSQPKENTFKRLVSGNLSLHSNHGATRPTNNTDSSQGSMPLQTQTQSNRFSQSQQLAHTARGSSAPHQGQQPAVSHRGNSSQTTPETAFPAHQRSSYHSPPRVHQAGDSSGHLPQHQSHLSQHAHRPQPLQQGRPPQARPPAPYNPANANVNQSPFDQSPVSNVSAFNGGKSHPPPNTKPDSNGPRNGHYPPSRAVPPWEKNKPDYTGDKHSNPPVMTQKTAVNPAANPVPSARQAAHTLNGTLTEVTSSYGGLYSSKQTNAPSRRRANHRPESGYGQYHLSNMTDDIKTSKGPFISAQPSVI